MHGVEVYDTFASAFFSATVRLWCKLQAWPELLLSLEQDHKPRTMSTHAVSANVGFGD